MRSGVDALNSRAVSGGEDKGEVRSKKKNTRLLAGDVRDYRLRSTCYLVSDWSKRLQTGPFWFFSFGSYFLLSRTLSMNLALTCSDCPRGMLSDFHSAPR